MQHITGISRHQMRISSLEDVISTDNQVRFIDAFCIDCRFIQGYFYFPTIKNEGHKIIYG
jgi:hypothetical protein